MKYALSGLLLLALLTVGILYTVAQDTDIATQQPEATPDNIERLTVPFGYDVVLQGLTGTGDHWIPLPYNWQAVGEMEIFVTYVASEAIQGPGATLTVSIGDLRSPVKTVSIVGDGQEHTFSFTVPGSGAYEGSGITIEYAGYLPTTDEECELASLPSQWLVVKGTSSVTLTPDRTFAKPDLSELSNILMANSPFIINGNMSVVLPDTFTTSDLNTALYFAEWLGTQYNGHPRPLAVYTVSTLPEIARTHSNLILIGELGTNRLISDVIPLLPYNALADDSLLTLDAEIVPDAHGILYLVQSPWNKDGVVFMMTGNAPAGVEQAGRSLLDESLQQSFNGQFNFIPPRANNPALASPDTPETDDIITLEELGYDTIEVNNIGVDSLEILITRRPGWRLKEGAEIVLNISSSELDPGSFITVFLDEIFIGTIITHDERQRQVSLSIPFEDINLIWDANPSSTTLLRLEVSNVFQTPNCQMSMEEAVWTRIVSSSFLRLPHTYVQLPDIESFPYPFTENSLTTTFVIPANPTLEEITLMLQLAAEIGEHTIPGTTLSILTADMPLDSFVQNVIVIGQPERNSMISSLLSQLPELETEMVYTTSGINNKSFTREAIAPWDLNSTVLLIYGDSLNSLNGAIYALNNRRIPDGALAEETHELRVIELTVPIPTPAP